MRRAAVLLFSSVGGIALLLNLKTLELTPATPTAAALTPVSNGDPIPAGKARALRPLSPGSSRAPGAAPPVAKVGNRSSRDVVPTDAPIPLSALDTGSTPDAKGRITRVGDAYTFVFGTTQVAVTMVGSRIVGVQPLSLPHKVARNVELADRAVPVLTADIMAAQSADVDVVSGATYTSEGYLRSVQSALDKINVARATTAPAKD